jgi:hypothetical protein
MDFSKRLEVAANLAIICLCLIVATVIAWKIAQPYGTPDTGHKPRTGETLELSGADWSRSEKTVVLAVSTRCHFCSESAPFYRVLVEATKAKNIRIIAIFPQPPSHGIHYLRELGVAVQEVWQAPLSTIHVSATPTLIIVNRKGLVTDAWVGKLPEAMQAEVISKL